MKLSKTLVLPIAGLLLVGAAGASLATTGAPPPVDQGRVIPAVDAATPTPAPSKAPVVKDPLLSDVLDQLVTKGTITAAQKSAILDALQAERTARRTLRQQEAQQLRDFLADGVITQDELNKLPADSPIRKLTNVMADGKITLDELRALGRGFMGKVGFGHGGMGGMGGGMWRAPKASPSPSTGTSG